MNKKMKTKLLSLAGALALSTVPLHAADFTMKVGHVAATTQPLYTCVEVLKAHVERFSGGRIAVEHYPAGQLGNFRQSVEQVQLGTLELTNTTGGGISNIFGPIQAFEHEAFVTVCICRRFLHSRSDQRCYSTVCCE